MRVNDIYVMSTQTEAIGARIREEREIKGLSKTAFAKLLGIHRNTQGNYESGEREPDAAYLANAAKADVDIGYVLTGERASAAHEALNHLVGVIFDALRLTPYEKEFDRVRQLAYEENLAFWRGEGIKEEADRATEAIIRKSPLFLVESVLTDLVERIEFVIESKAISLTPLAKAEIIFRLYQQAKTQGQPIDLQSIAAAIEDRRL